MTSDLLRRIGEALFGPRWQSELTRELGVADRTMRRWVAGEGIPEGEAADLSHLLTGRAAEIDRLIKIVKQGDAAYTSNTERSRR